MIRENNTLLEARIEDLFKRSERGEIVYSDFLSPAECKAVEKLMRSKGAVQRCYFYGGYSEAERKRVFFLPEYAEGAEDFSEIEQYFDEKPICALLICGSGYRKLTHRDYLGSILGLGLERAVVGDIVFRDDAKDEAVIFCDKRIADFLKSELIFIANDKVKVSEITVEENFAPNRNFSHISDTVASPRFDCVVSAVCSLSREKASALIKGGYADLDYETEERPDRNLTVPCIISVRGYGKFRINSLSEHTKKGRLRLNADKYI